MTKRTKAVRQISCIVAFLSICVGSARAAIPNAPDLPSQKQYLAKLAEFNLRGCLAIYKTTGKHDEKWDKDAISFITDAIKRPSPQRDLDPLGALEHRGQELIGRGCDDGLAQYLCGMIQLDEVHRADAERSLRTACDSLAAQGYPPHLRARAASEICTMLMMEGRNGEMQQYSGEMETGAAPAADHNVITLKRRGDTIKAIVNGKQVYEGEPFNFVARRDIGFGGWPNSPGDSYRYRNVKIKKATD